jgi:transcriptional regulator with XRE-family HTH domain
MRSSALRHPLAVLRQVIGKSQKEMAELVGKTAATIQAIELKKLNLSEDLAAKIEEETGVSAAWLLDGDVNRPIRNRFGASYLTDDYELARAKRSKLPAHIDALSMASCHVMGLQNGERLARVFAAAMRAKPSKFQVAMFLADKWLEEMEQKFGKPADDYLEYRSRVTVTHEDVDGYVGKIPGGRSPSAGARELSNYLRSVAETEGQAVADKVLADIEEQKSSKKRKKAAGSAKSPA